MNERATKRAEERGRRKKEEEFERGEDYKKVECGDGGANVAYDGDPVKVESKGKLESGRGDC